MDTSTVFKLWTKLFSLFTVKKIVIFQYIGDFFSVLKFFKCSPTIFQSQARNIRYVIEYFLHNFI